MKQLFLIFIFSLMSFSHGYAASCCAGGGGSTQIITAQNKSEMRLSITHSDVVAEKFQSPRVLVWDTNREQLTTTLSPSYGQKLNDDWQLGVRTEVVSKNYRLTSQAEQSTTRLGDSFVMLAYEALEMSSILSWRPQVFLSLETTFPTGRGLYESKESSLVDVSGSGRWEQKIGAAFIKMRPGYKLNFSLNYLHSFKEKYDEFTLHSKDSFLTEIGISTNHPRRKSIFGLNIRFNNKSSFILSADDIDQKIPKEQFFDFSPYLSYLFSKNSLITLTYSDQTILGPVYNTNLSRSISLNLMRFLTL